MKLGLRFSPQVHLESFRSQCYSLQQLLQVAKKSVSDLNDKIPEVMQYPADAIAASLSVNVKAALSSIFLSHRQSLHFDAEEFGLRYGCIDPQKVDIKKASNLALFRFATATRSDCAEEVRGRLDSLTKGEIALFLNAHPQLQSRFFALNTTLTTSEEFAHLCRVYERGTVKELTSTQMHDLLAGLESTVSLLDINELAKCAGCFVTTPDYLLRNRLIMRASAEVKKLSPSAYIQLVETVAGTRTRIKESQQVLLQLSSAFDDLDLSQLSDQMLASALECFQRVGVNISSHMRQKLALNIDTRMDSADPVWKAKLHILRAVFTARKDHKVTLLMADKLIFRRNTDALVNLLPVLIGSQKILDKLTLMLSNASLESIMTIVRLMKQYGRRDKILSIEVENCLLQRITDKMSFEAVETCCGIMGFLKHLDYNAEKASAALGDIVAQHPEWMNPERLVTLAHQFAYVSRHKDVCKVIGEYLKQCQQEEVVSDSVSVSDMYYYVEGEKFHKPQNVALTSRAHGHVAVLVVSLQRGRLVNAGAQKVVKQFSRCLALHFPLLNVKHRSSLMFGASLRENFDVTVWNELVKAANHVECHAFDTEETMRSLSLYRAAAANVKNMTRKPSSKDPLPLELVINGKVLETYTTHAVGTLAQGRRY